MTLPSSSLERLDKRGKRTIGALYNMPAGRCYMVWSRTKYIRCGDEKDISAAIRNGKAAWAFDEETLLNLRAEGVRFVGVLNRDTGDRYVTTIERVFDPTICLPYESRGRGTQRFLSLNAFKRRVGNAKV